MIARIFVGIAVLAAGAASAAETPLPSGLPDLVGPRTLGLSASIGVAAGNEGIWVNPGAIAARRRYSIESGGYVDRRGADTVSRFYGGSVLDSQTAEVAGAFSYVRADENPNEGGVWTGVLAGSIAEGLYLGLAGKYLSFKGPRNTSAGTVDAGLFWQVADYVSVGAAAYNLVSIDNPSLAPLGYGAGVGIGSDRNFQLTAEWRADVDRAPKQTNRWSVGAEMLLGQLVPVRAGWVKDETLGGTWWSVGAGLVTRGGVALDFGYRQSLEDPSARTLAAAIKIFVFR